LQVNSYAQQVLELEVKSFSTESQRKELQDANTNLSKKAEEQDSQIRAYAQKVLELEANNLKAEAQIKELQDATSLE
jgi:TolA-binding protein